MTRSAVPACALSSGCNRLCARNGAAGPWRSAPVSWSQATLRAVRGSSAGLAIARSIATAYVAPARPSGSVREPGGAASSLPGYVLAAAPGRRGFVFAPGPRCQGPGEVDVGAGFRQLLLGLPRRLRAGDVDRTSAPRMADRAVDQGTLRVDALDPEVPRVVGPIADQVADIDMLMLRQLAVRVATRTATSVAWLRGR